MMRVAKEIAPLYPELNLDLLLTGILFHDSGKTLGERVRKRIRNELWTSSAN